MLININQWSNAIFNFVKDGLPKNIKKENKKIESIINNAISNIIIESNFSQSELNAIYNNIQLIPIEENGCLAKIERFIRREVFFLTPKNTIEKIFSLVAAGTGFFTTTCFILSYDDTDSAYDNYCNNLRIQNPQMPCLGPTTLKVNLYIMMAILSFSPLYLSLILNPTRTKIKQLFNNVYIQNTIKSERLKLDNTH